MKLETGTYVKLGLIVALCVLVCGFCGGCLRDRGAVLAPLWPLGGVAGCMGLNAFESTVDAVSESVDATVEAIDESWSTDADGSEVPDPPAAPSAPDAPDAPDASDAPGIGGIADPSEVPTATHGRGNFEVDAAKVKAIELNWLAGKVNVRTVPDSEAGGVVRGTEVIAGAAGNAPALFWDIDDSGVLSIDYTEAGGLVGCSAAVRGQKELTVLLPESLGKQLGTFELEAASGRYQLGGLTCQRLELDVASGEVNAEGLSAQSVELTLASGQVKIEGAIAGALDIDQASGNSAFTCSEVAPKTVRGSLGSGGIDLVLPSDTNVVATGDKMSGSFNNGFANASQSASGTGATCNLAFDIASGSFSVRPAS